MDQWLSLLMVCSVSQDVVPVSHGDATAIVVLFISSETVVGIMMHMGVGLDMGLVILTLSVFYSFIP